MHLVFEAWLTPDGGYQLKAIYVSLVVAGLLAACNTTSSSNIPSDAKPISVSFKWCSGSPEFQLGGVPAGTKTLSFHMIDKQAQSFQHGGGTVAYTGSNTIACGALTGGQYVGPNPPPPQVHDYEWTVLAKDASGNVIGAGKASRKFPE